MTSRCRGLDDADISCIESLLSYAAANHVICSAIHTGRIMTTKLMRPQYFRNGPLGPPSIWLTSESSPEHGVLLDNSLNSKCDIFYRYLLREEALIEMVVATWHRIKVKREETAPYSSE